MVNKSLILAFTALAAAAPFGGASSSNSGSKIARVEKRADGEHIPEGLNYSNPDDDDETDWYNWEYDGEDPGTQGSNVQNQVDPEPDTTTVALQITSSAQAQYEQDPSTSAHHNTTLREVQTSAPAYNAVSTTVRNEIPAYTTPVQQNELETYDEPKQNNEFEAYPTRSSTVSRFSNEVAPSQYEPKPTLKEEIAPQHYEAEPTLKQEIAPQSYEPEPTLKEVIAPQHYEAEPTLKQEIAPSSYEAEPTFKQEIAPAPYEAEPTLKQEVAPAPYEAEPTLKQEIAPSSYEAEPTFKQEVAPAPYEAEPTFKQEVAPAPYEAEPTFKQEVAPAPYEAEPTFKQEIAPSPYEAEPTLKQEIAPAPYSSASSFNNEAPPQSYRGPPFRNALGSHNRRDVQEGYGKAEFEKQSHVPSTTAAAACPVKTPAVSAVPAVSPSQPSFSEAAENHVSQVSGSTLVAAKQSPSSVWSAVPYSTPAVKPAEVKPAEITPAASSLPLLAAATPLSDKAVPSDAKILVNNLRPNNATTESAQDLKKNTASPAQSTVKVEQISATPASITTASVSKAFAPLYPTMTGVANVTGGIAAATTGAVSHSNNTLPEFEGAAASSSSFIAGSVIALAIAAFAL